MIERDDIYKNSKIKLLKDIIRNKFKNNNFILIYNNNILDEQKTFKEYSIKKISKIEIVFKDNKFKEFFLKNAKYVILYGFVYGIGHFLSAVFIDTTLLDLKDLIN